MKKLFIPALLLLALVSNAQTEQGSTIVGGALSLQTTKNNSSFAVNPNVGVFVFDNFAVGGLLSLNFSKQGDVKNNQVGIGPYARYYFGKSQTKPFFTVEGSYLNSKIETANAKISTNGYGFLVGLGFAAFINEVVAVDGVTGYNYSDFKNNTGAGGFALRLGFQLYFNHKSYSTLKSNVTGGSSN